MPGKKKKHKFTVTERFGDEELTDIVKRGFVRFVNDQQEGPRITLQEKKKIKKSSDS